MLKNKNIFEFVTFKINNYHKIRLFSKMNKHHIHAIKVSESNIGRRKHGEESKYLNNAFITGYHQQPYEFKVDESVEHGGNDSAPTPMDYFLVSLASCTSQSIRRHADKRNYKLDQVVVKIDHERNTQRGKKGDDYALDIELYGDLTHEQRMELLKAGENESAVAKSLTSPSKLDYRLVEDPSHGSGRTKHKTKHHR